MKPRQHGYSLIELIVVIGIIALLASLAFPSYTAYVQRGNRTDATRVLTTTSQALERCYSQFFDYTNAACTGAGGVVPAKSPNGYYTVTLAAVSPTDYTLQATATGAPQNTDTDCQVFQVGASTGQSALNAGGVDNTKVCWGSK